MPTKQIEKHLSANMNLTKKQIILANFLGGLSWGVGSAIGATIVLSLIYGTLKTLNFLPFAGQVTDGIEQRTQIKSD